MDEALRDAVASAYSLGPIRACVRFDRVASSVARVETAEHVYWLKLNTRSVRDLDTLESEAEIATELAERGVQVARAVRRRDGRYAGELTLAEGIVPAFLFFESPGTEVEAPSLAQAEALGGLSLGSTLSTPAPPPGAGESMAKRSARHRYARPKRGCSEPAATLRATLRADSRSLWTR